jgi:acetyl-CoA C-acetyltransferase
MEVFIVGAKRTPIGSFLGSLSDVPATKLGSIALKGAMEAAQVAPEWVDEVFFGNVLSANLGQAPAKQIALGAGLLPRTPCTIVNKVCASGAKAVMLAATMIRAGEGHIIAAGGTESMSNAPFYLPSHRKGHKYGNQEVVDAIVKDGLQDAYKCYMMGEAGEICATHYHISREEQDQYAIQSYQRANAAMEKGYFKDEIVPVVLSGNKGEIRVEEDEEPKRVIYEKIPTLRPAFRKEGTITAANASKLNDGASALILASESAVKQYHLKPLARIVAYADASKEPEWFTIAPVDAMTKALKKANLNIADIDLFEINEAFSVVALVNQRLLGIPMEKLNVHGGAVALGHPIGCSGARILVTLINALRIHKGKYGMIGICNGGGGASAILIENLQ